MVGNARRRGMMGWGGAKVGYSPRDASGGKPPDRGLRCAEIRQRERAAIVHWVVCCSLGLFCPVACAANALGWLTALGTRRYPQAGEPPELPIDSSAYRG